MTVPAWGNRRRSGGDRAGVMMLSMLYREMKGQEICGAWRSFGPLSPLSMLYREMKGQEIAVETSGSSISCC